MDQSNTVNTSAVLNHSQDGENTIVVGNSEPTPVTTSSKDGNDGGNNRTVETESIAKDDCSDLTDHNDDNEEQTPKSFPEKLFEILSNEAHSDVITWLPHGNGFIINKKKTFANEILPKFFKATKFTSFTRKLNRWGFSRAPRGPETGAYFHNMFHRDKPELCLQMTSNSLNKFQSRPMQHMMPNVPGMIPAGMAPMPMLSYIPNPMMGSFTPQQQQQVLWQQQMQLFNMQQMQMMQQQQQQQRPPNNMMQPMPTLVGMMPATMSSVGIPVAVGQVPMPMQMQMNVPQLAMPMHMNMAQQQANMQMISISQQATPIAVGGTNSTAQGDIKASQQQQQQDQTQCIPYQSAMQPHPVPMNSGPPSLPNGGGGEAELSMDGIGI